MIKDYNIYTYSRKEKIIYFLQGLAIALIIGILLYKSLIGIIILGPFPYFFLKRKNKKLIEERKWQLNIEFRDGITSILAGLNAGHSIEHALKESLSDLKLIYDVDSLIIREFTYLINKINVNQTVEQVLIDFGQRSKVEDIINFADVFLSAKRTGGDIIRIIDTSCTNIRDKIEIKREIRILYAAKKFESDIMKFIPVAILLYLWVFSPGYTDPLYHNALGIIIMTILFIIYVLGFLLIEKIMDIEI